jgi:murein DD-endopeptidase MepM/ murein hydrolase activator NlpD
VTNIRALRLSHGLSLIDLALLSDIPARTLAEIEYGLQRLDYESRSRLARVFDLPPEQIWAGSAPPPARKAAWQLRAMPVVAVALAGVLLSDSLLHQLPQLSAATRAEQPSPAAQRRAAAPPSVLQPAPARAALRASPTAVPTSAPARSVAIAEPATPTPAAPTPPPRFILAADGPHGCPLAPEIGGIVMTQGYDVGTHAPASTWGAVDLAIDGDGDGSGEPGATQGMPIAATLGGVARVTLNSWPGGNFVRVVNEQSGWSVAYAHLDSVSVAEGQVVLAGDTIGTVGSTGQTSGPHLHYEVWHDDENVDPTGLVSCW